MTSREVFLTEVWKEESQVVGVRLIELDEKRQDCGLTSEEEIEYKTAKEEWSRLLRGMLNNLRDVRSA
jgi:hypothetical protein